MGRPGSRDNRVGVAERGPTGDPVRTGGDAILGRVSSQLTFAAPAPDEAFEKSGRRGPWWVLDRLALAISALSGLVLFAFIGRGGWYIDDFLNLSLAQESPLGRFYIDRPIFGHPQPGTRLANWLLYRLAPMNYALAAALVCAAVALVSWMIYRILRLTFRPTPWVLVLTSMAAATGLWVPVAAWWAGGSEIAGCIMASTLTVHAVLCSYLGRHRIIWGVLAGVWTLGGLAFYERSLLGGAFALCFLLTFACTRFSWREIARVVRQAWPAFVVLPVVAVAYLIYYATHSFVHTQPGYTKLEVLHFFWIAWSWSLIPGLFGGSLHTGQVIALSYSAPPIWWRVVCQVLLLGLVGFGVRRRGLRALVPWLYFIPFFVAASYAVATARLHVHGPGAGREYRYVADLLPLLVLTLAGTVLRPSGRWAILAGDPDEPTDEPAGPVGEIPVHRAGPTDRPAITRRLLPVGAALAGLWLVYLITAVPVSSRWLAGRHVYYVPHMQVSIRQHDAAGPWSVYERFVPGDVSIPSYGRYSLVSRIAQLAVGHPISVNDLSKPMYLFDPSGTLRPAEFRQLATAPAACSTTDQLRVMQPVSRALPMGYWNVQLDYTVPKPTTLRFAISVAGGEIQEATGSYTGFPVSGSGRLTFLVRRAAITGFRLDAAVPGVCISHVQLGEPIAARQAP